MIEIDSRTGQQQQEILIAEHGRPMMRIVDDGYRTWLQGSTVVVGKP
jgi:hypothetical protein